MEDLSSVLLSIHLIRIEKYGIDKYEKFSHKCILPNFNVKRILKMLLMVSKCECQLCGLYLHIEISPIWFYRGDNYKI